MVVPLRTLALVPARGGSKRLPRKNLARICGLTLVEHAIAFARMCPEVDRIAVTTDDDETAAVAAAAGAAVLRRPAGLASDETSSWAVVRHALAQLDPEEELEVVLLVQPSSPVRFPADVVALLERLGEDGAFTVTDGRPNGLLYAWRTSFVRSAACEWSEGRLTPYEIPRGRAFDIDDAEDLRRVAVAVESGAVRLPWRPCADSVLLEKPPQDS